MIPTNSELIFWCALCVVVLFLLAQCGKRKEKDEYMSDYWIDRNIYGKK